ncbi:MAG TPA: hypothetical protein VK511_07565 [Gemmatimonadaceae bacterium]|nr:hypothetical protein [Gemmatimonadaceae bacterium]
MTITPEGAAAVVIPSAIAIWSLWSSRTTARQSNAIQERLLILEKARDRERVAANLRIPVSAAFSPKELVLTNRRAFPAYNVGFLINGAHRKESKIFRAGDLETIAELAPGVSYPFHLMTYDNMPRTHLVKVTWTDENGDEGEWQSTLHIPIGR